MDHYSYLGVLFWVSDMACMVVYSGLDLLTTRNQDWNKSGAAWAYLS